MKKILNVLLVLVLSFLLVSCTTNQASNNEDQPINNTENNNDNNNNNEENNDKPDDNGENNSGDNNQNENNDDNDNHEDDIVIVFDYDESKVILSDAFKSYELRYNKDKCNELKQVLLDVIEKKSGLDALNKAYDDLNEYYSEINDLYIVVEVFYYINPDNEVITNAYNDIYDYSLIISTAIEEVEHEIAKSEYAKEFFSGYTDEEIEALASTEVDNDELNRLLVLRQTLVDDYYAATSSRLKNNVLKEFIKVNKDIAVQYGYEANEYIEFSDTNDYYRQYSTSDIDNFSKYVLDYILEPAFDIEDVWIKVKDADKKQYAKYTDRDKFFENKSLLDEFATAMGGKFLEVYNDLWENGYYAFSNYSTELGTAFQNNSDDINLVFFSNYYQDLSTIAHEFGHYFAASQNAAYYSYDVCEIHSQGDEVLFRLYLSEKYPNTASESFEFDFVYSLLSCIVIGVLIREYEEELYKDDVSNIKTVWNKINEKYDNYAPEDWYDIFIEYNNYYISYATSAFGALLLYAYGKENGFEAARDLYLQIFDYDGTGDLTEILQSINLGNPFDEETFIYISEVIEEVINDAYPE